jgi:hypothetical protein
MSSELRSSDEVKPIVSPAENRKKTQWTRDIPCAAGIKAVQLSAIGAISDQDAQIN